MAYNASLDRLRERKALQQLPEDEPDGPLALPSLHTPLPRSPEALLRDAETREALEQAIAELPHAQRAAFLLRDLAQRGLLDDTLVIWGGEFGRMPMSEQGTGRDHNPWGYSVVLAGAGVKPGFAYGATDAVGLRAAENKVHVHDLHATILHLLGMDHQKLTYFHNGRDERLTDVAGKVVTEILA